MKSGLEVSSLRCLIAATGLVHDFIIVTRNVRDFGVTGAKVLDPFA